MFVLHIQIIGWGYTQVVKIEVNVIIYKNTQLAIWVYIEKKKHSNSFDQDYIYQETDE